MPPSLIHTGSKVSLWSPPATVRTPVAGAGPTSVGRTGERAANSLADSSGSVFNLGRPMPRTGPHGDASLDAKPTLFVSTGCSSSDLMLAPVLTALKNRGVVGSMTGLGGEPLAEAGVSLIYDTTPVGAVGLAAGLRTLGRHALTAIRAYREISRSFLETPPSLAILVDNPGLNVRLLSMAHRRGIPTVYFIPPERWAIWSFEARSIARKATAIIPIFQQEEAFYREQSGAATWYGHPIVDLIPRAPRGENAPNGPMTIALFPGSREQEVRVLLPVLRVAAARIHARQPNVRFVICSPNAIARRMIENDRWRWTVPFELAHRRSHDVLARCDLLLCCSGTATLEASIFGVPMVAMYRVSSLIDRFLQVVILPMRKYPYFSLPNLLLGRPAVPELGGSLATPENVAREALALLEDPKRRAAARASLDEVCQKVGPPGALARIVEAIEGMLVDGVASKQSSAARTATGTRSEPVPLAS